MPDPQDWDPRLGSQRMTDPQVWDPRLGSQRMPDHLKMDPRKGSEKKAKGGRSRSLEWLAHLPRKEQKRHWGWPLSLCWGWEQTGTMSPRSTLTKGMSTMASFATGAIGEPSSWPEPPETTPKGMAGPKLPSRQWPGRWGRLFTMRVVGGSGGQWRQDMWEKFWGVLGWGRR